MKPENENRSNLPYILKRYRLKAGYSQQNVAHVLRCNRSTYSYYETGKTVPNFKRLERLAELYHISLYELLCTEVVGDEIISPKRLKKAVKDPEKITGLSHNEISIIAILRTKGKGYTTELLERLSKEQ